MKVAVVGLGKMGQSHYRVLKEMPAIDVVAVCDPNGTIEVPCPKYKNVEEMLRSTVELDAAIISSPSSSHCEAAVACIERGVAVLIEKPLAATVTEGITIRDAAAHAGVRAAVGHVERFNPVISRLASELVGKRVYSISITRVGPFPPRVVDVGVLVDLSVHDVDLIRFLARDHKILESRVFKGRSANATFEDSAVVAFRLDSDVVATATTNWLTPFKKRTIEVATDKAYYEGDLVTQELVEYSAYETDNSYVVRHCNVQREEPLWRELCAFVEYLAHGDPGSIATVDDGLAALEIIGRCRTLEPCTG